MNFIKIPYMPDPSNTISCVLHFKKHDITTCCHTQGPKIWKKKALSDLKSWMGVFWPFHDPRPRTQDDFPPECLRCSRISCPARVGADGLSRVLCGAGTAPNTRTPARPGAHGFKRASWHGRKYFAVSLGASQNDLLQASRKQAYIISCKRHRSFKGPVQGLWNTMLLLRNLDKCRDCCQK